MSHSFLNREAFACSICLDLPKKPVLTPCGHSFCTNCIEQDWDQQNESYSCPLCTQSFSPRPELRESIAMANLMEELKSVVLTEGQQLVAPSNKLQESICSEHNRLKGIFCYKDKTVICYLCSQGPHWGHFKDSAAAERARRQAELPRHRTARLDNIQTKETDLERLQQEAQDISRSAQTAVQRSEDSFREMVLLLEKRRSEVEQQIRSEEQNQLKPVLDLQDQLQQDITDLKKSVSGLDTLSKIVDHGQFLQLWPSLFTQLETAEPVEIPTREQRDFEDVTTAVSALRDKLKLTLEEDLSPGPAE